jgi:serpin B
MKRYLVFSLVVMWAMTTSQAAVLPRNVDVDANTLVAGNTDFALQMYGELAEREPGNLFFSPYGLSTALAMTYAGARGETERQMAEVLNFSLPQQRLHQTFGALEKQLNQAGDKGQYELNVANALWGQKDYGLRREFLQLIEANFGGGLEEVDFVNATEKARQTINGWVEEKTQDKIKDLIGPGVLDRLTVLVLTNAIYFKGDWAAKFKEENTKFAPFHVVKYQTADDSPGEASGAGTVQASLMHQEGRFKYGLSDDLQLLELPYKGNDLSMVVFLPKKVDGLAEVERSLAPDNLNRWLRHLHDTQVELYLPKFKIATGPVELKDILVQMGMPTAFSRADFSGMTGSKELFISNVLHKAFVEVNEEGTEAAAATAVVMGRGRTEAIPVFRADHPFVFMIRHNPTGSILFMGRVTDPGQTAVSQVSQDKLPQDKSGNFTLHVSNQSFAIDPVDIKVYVDGKLAIDQKFEVGTGKRRQHNWQTFQFQLSDGRHRLRVESKKGQASLEEQFEVKGKRWVVLDYWFGGREDSQAAQKKFTFHVSDEPIYFE